MSDNASGDLSRLAARQRRMGLGLTATMMAIYLGFILLVAFARPFLGREVAPGLSFGILLGALVIVSAWGLIWIYVAWANRHYDGAVSRLKAGRS